MFIVGPPAAGKTTLARHLLGPKAVPLAGDPPMTIADGVVAIGHFPSGRFGGGDHIPPGGGERALEAARMLDRPLTIIDGNRFAVARHRGTAIRLFDRVLVVHLTAPEHVCHQRRIARGSKTNPAWMLGRRGQAERFAESHPQTLNLDSTVSTAQLAAAVRARLALMGLPG